ncbi:DUF6520 family protein [Flavobacterium sp. LB2P84]|jgi:hypothetical protein|uniref:DUF6520 family protein n=1 Tax=Flavobacterium TaxID=237 RepID=UPI000EABE2CA|nr:MULTISPECIES: DUF6520 family protein [Flavobacterium]MDI6034184.1 DUF6520 family protein [Flavobacterium yafengii]RKS14282.1 hypothetical protein C8C87_1556 [Flavobacterium sp. 120]
MKTNFLKLIMPVAVVLLATGSALSTSAMNKKADTAPVQGYVHVLTEDDCDESIMCSDIEGDLCTTGSEQVFGKNPANKCTVRLFKNQ